MPDRRDWREIRYKAEVALILFCMAVPWLTGCTQAPSIEPARIAAMNAWLAQEQSPLAVRSVAAWYPAATPGNLICGEIAAPAALEQYRSTLRYVFFPDSAGDFRGVIEKHELIAANDLMGQSILAESRRIFDSTWEQCGANAPIDRRIAAWFGPSSPGDGGTDTPITNAYADDILAKTDL